VPARRGGPARRQRQMTSTHTDAAGLGVADGAAGGDDSGLAEVLGWSLLWVGAGVLDAVSLGASLGVIGAP
jgi:hypothetical protein